MNINLDNYESFFLLYVDNELSAAEKAAVDAFVEQHPYLGKELQLLQGVVLPAGDAVVLDKNSLYRSSAIAENMEEAMLLQLDNELPESSSKDLMENIKGEEALQQNWEQLLKTRLPAEAIIFTDKNSLYKKEPATIVSFRFVKWAVAAALLAAGFFTAVMLLRQQAQTGVQFVKSPGKQEGKGTNPGKINDRKEVNETNNSTNQMPEAAAAELAKQEANPEGLSDNKDASTKPRLVTTNNTKELVSAKLPEAKENKSVIKTVAKEEPVNVLASNSSPVKLPANTNELSMSTGLASTTARPVKEIIDRDIVETKQGFAKLASLEEDEEVNNDRILGMDADAVGRTKAGVFFKKLKRTVARSANIKTGNSLKIAGFEFAVK